MNKEEITVSAEVKTYLMDLYSQIEYELQEQYNDEVQKLQQENQELKRNCNIGNENLNFYREENKKLINQQKEFIDYMENEINKFKELEKFAREVFDNNKIINIGLAQKTIEENNLLISNFNIILSKYKSIIGVSDE
jgi:hypothetical protein